MAPYSGSRRLIRPAYPAQRGLRSRETMAAILNRDGRVPDPWSERPMPSSSIKRKEREPRWTAFVAMLADGLVYLALPERLSVGPSWLLLAVIFVLLIPITVTYHRERYDVTKILTFGVNAVITLALVGSLGLLIQGLPSHRDPPAMLLRSAGALWVTRRPDDSVVCRHLDDVPRSRPRDRRIQERLRRQWALPRENLARLMEG